MRETKKPENTIFYSNYKDMIYNATPEEVKEIMTAFCLYAFDDEEPQVSGQIKLLWGIIKGNIDRDRAQYLSRCEQNRENAKKRHLKTQTTEQGSNESNKQKQYLQIKGITYIIEYDETEIECIPKSSDDFCKECNNNIDIVSVAIEHGNSEGWLEDWRYYCYVAKQGTN